MLELIKKFRKIIIVVSFVLIAIIIISTQSGTKKSKLMQEGIIVFFTAPVQGAFESIADAIGGVINKYFFIVGKYDENVQLKEENIKLRGENYKFKEIEQENLRLRDLLNFKKQGQNTELLPAEVVAIDSQSEFKSIRIDKGAKDGIKEQYAVVTSAGIVGQIIKTYAYYSDVLLITDRYSSVDAIIQRTRSRGVLEGDLTKCNLKYVLRDDDVKAGDFIISSGLDMVFPKGLALGYVSSINKEKYGILQEITVSPAINFSRLEEVLVVMKSQVIDVEASDKATSEKK